MSTANRRYDIDWIRVIAIGLLLIYHIAIGFQPWGMMIAFITNKESWESLWIPMMALNVWRIPLLFFVSGMGIFFAMQNRNWKELIKERTFRIWLPFVFGMFCIVPLHVYLWQSYYGMSTSYVFNPGHLWFLGNIMCYVLIWSPLFFYLKKNEDGVAVKWIQKIFSTPLIWGITVAVFTAEAMIIKPIPYELYAMTWHGLFLGLLAFFFGFCFVLAGDSFWNMIVKWRWVFVAIAVGLFILRWQYFAMNTPAYRLVMESQSWIFSVLAFGHRYLNKPGKALSYLSKAAYPVYILHMIFLYLGSALLFPLEVDVKLKFIALLVITLAGCFLVYEFIIRRVSIIGFLFGVKKQNKTTPG